MIDEDRTFLFACLAELEARLTGLDRPDAPQQIRQAASQVVNAYDDQRLPARDRAAESLVSALEEWRWDA